MKHAFMLTALVLVASLAVGQTLQTAKVFEKHYGAASFKADTNYVTTATLAQRYVTVTVSYDTTAGTTIAYFCPNNDSTNAQPIFPGTGGSYGDTFTFKQWGLKFFRIKGAVPITVRITP